MHCTDKKESMYKEHFKCLHQVCTVNKRNKFNQYLLSFYNVSGTAKQSYSSEGSIVVPEEGERG